ncbi:glycosyltransferase family 2 protein [Candidatus Woesearchaeota archaeon]|nr:glycosyltransferase family 2 protein [Candidatus Woesearchaeota archaeon]
MTVGIITPVYAAKKSYLRYLEDAIESVPNQGADIIHIVVDDGSPTDVASWFHQTISDPRIRYLRRERAPSDIRTASNARNLGLQALLDPIYGAVSPQESAEIKYVAFLDADDRLTPMSIDLRVSAFTPQTAFVYGMFIYVNSITGSQDIRGRAFRNEPATGLNPDPPLLWTAMFRRDFLVSLRESRNRLYGHDLFDPSMTVGEDIDVMLSAFELLEEKPDITSTFIRFPVYSHRKIRESTTNLVSRRKDRTDYARFCEKHDLVNDDKLSFLDRLSDFFRAIRLGAIRG